jgi:hypothetical protein
MADSTYGTVACKFREYAETIALLSEPRDRTSAGVVIVNYLLSQLIVRIV